VPGGFPEFGVISGDFILNFICKIKRGLHFIKLCKCKMENFEDLVDRPNIQEGKAVEQVFTTESDSVEPSSPVSARAENTISDIPNRRASIAVSNISNMIDPNIPNTISSWISQAARAKRRATMIDHSSVRSSFISLHSPNGVDFSKYSEISDQDLPREFERILVRIHPHYEIA
jgi:hypothetical protein